MSAEDGLTRCRWFSRGWTLQELLAPTTVEFYDMAWTYRGSKLEFGQIISNSTNIPAEILLRNKFPGDFSVAQRMSWAARRQTKRVEDMAYCLLGIFDVNMALIYGEGLKAFRRLQEEIVKRNNDMTIFAWDVSQHEEQQAIGLFATSPLAFACSSGVVPFADDFQDFTVTNKGLLISGDVPLRAVMVTEEKVDRKTQSYFLCLGSNPELSTNRGGGICLRKLGPRLFCRDGSLVGFGGKSWRILDRFDVTSYYILIDPITTNISSYSSSFRERAIHVPFDDVFRLADKVPESLWDFRDRVFLRPKPYTWTQYPTAIAMAFRGSLARTNLELIVLCDYRDEFPTCKIFQRHEYSHQVEMIFSGRHRSESIFWEEIAIDAPEILQLSDCVELRVRNDVYRISASFETGIVASVSTASVLYSLKLYIVNI